MDSTSSPQATRMFDGIKKAKDKAEAKESFNPKLPAFLTVMFRRNEPIKTQGTFTRRSQGKRGRRQMNTEWIRQAHHKYRTRN